MPNAPIAPLAPQAAAGPRGRSAPTLPEMPASNPTALVDAQGRIRAVSTSFASALRIRRDELFAHPLPTLVRLEDRPALAHAIAAVASGDWPGCSLEVGFLQHLREDRAVRLMIEADEAMKVRIHATDLTAERLATRALHEYQESLRALTAHALDIWALLDETGTLRSVSESVSVHLGWPARELEGKRLPDFVHPDDLPSIDILLHDLKHDPTLVRSAVVRARHQDGGWRTLETTTSGFNPGVLGNSVFVVNARDVTARERTEATLREVEYRFSQLVEQALTGIVVVQDGVLVYANPRFLQLLGADAGLIARRTRVLSLIDRRSIPRLREVRTALATGSHQSTRIQLRGVHVLGHPLEVEVATSLVDFAGRPALLCTVTDMTESRALQLRMAEAEKIEAVGLLAGGVAHDFNNMLTSILAWVDIAADEVGPSSPVRQALDEIRTSAERGAELTRQLLAFGRRQFLEPRPLDLGEVAVRLKRWMDRVLGTDHRLDVRVPDATWLIEADRMQIERALTALIMNARDAMPKGGTIAVVVEHAVLEAEEAARLGPLQAGEHVVVRVRDAGQGMDEPTRRRIFEPFFTTKPQGHGTGLGLPAVLGTVLQSGGAIDVRSEPGIGTEFHCYFPRHEALAATDAPPRPSAELRARPARRVLVVEDDPQLGKILRRLLQEGGHAVRLAANADEAEALASAESIEVLVCDQELPGTRGSALAQRLCGRGAARGTVLISGRPIDAAEREESGPHTTVLLKPFRPQQLLEVIEEIAAGRTAAR